MIEVLKIGGQQLDDQLFLEQLACLVASAKRKLVIVHGGGQATTQLSQRLGIEPRFIEGLRATDGETLAAAIMGLVGSASARVVSFLVAQGVMALGLSGFDAGLVRCQVQTQPPGLGFVGHPSRVEAQRLRALLEAGFVPCLAPICIGENGTQLYNVNADPVAASVAAHLGSSSLTMLTNVAGIQSNGRIQEGMNVWEVEAAIESGEISGGMIPKVRAAIEALSCGVHSVRICDLAGLSRLWQQQEGPKGTVLERVTLA